MRISDWSSDVCSSDLARLRAALAAARDGTSWRPAVAIVMLSFLYGVFHAVGPGHGKAVLGSYSLTPRAQALHGPGASFLSAAGQPVAAIVLVGLLNGVVDVTERTSLVQDATLAVRLYGDLILPSIWKAWG